MMRSNLRLLPILSSSLAPLAPPPPQKKTPPASHSLILYLAPLLFLTKARTRFYDELNKSGEDTKPVTPEPIFIDPYLINFEHASFYRQILTVKDRFHIRRAETCKKKKRKKKRVNITQGWKRTKRGLDCDILKIKTKKHTVTNNKTKTKQKHRLTARQLRQRKHCTVYLTVQLSFDRQWLTSWINCKSMMPLYAIFTLRSRQWALLFIHEKNVMTLQMRPPHFHVQYSEAWHSGIFIVVERIKRRLLLI